MNQESQIDTDVNLYFIIPSKYESENDCTEEMWHAYNKCCEHDLEPRWITDKKCSKMEPAKNDVFVMEEFEGDAFDKLKTFKCPIVGPRCLLVCFINGEPIPEGNNPVYTTAMRGLCVCASGLPPEEKEHITKLVEYMGGIFTKQLRSRVTHLVTGSVMSAKYETAIDMQIPIVTKEWVEAIWKTNLNDFIKADDSIFNKYKAPVFLNLVVTSTNLPKRQKEEIKRLINDNGGTFMGPLDGAKVKVVLAPTNSPISDKLKYAKQANIACLTPDWVYESLKVGYALPFKDYLITSLKVSSTPEKSNVYESLNCSAISTIPCDLQQINGVDETLTTTMSSVSTVEHFINNTANVLDRLTFSEAKSAGPFLDGCNIYLAGFAANQRDKINKILNVGSATRLDDISDVLTHVIVGDENKASSELKLMKSKGLCPYILNLEWLEQSIKLKRPAPEENFLFEALHSVMQKAPEPPSPLSKKNLQMLQKPRKVSIPAFDIDRKLSMIEKENEKQTSDILEQYLQDTIVVANENTLQEFLKPQTPITEETNNKTLVDNNKKEEKNVKGSFAQSKLADDSSVPISQVSTLNDKLFEGLTFVVIGFNDEDSYVAETIIAMGGQVVSSTFSGIPDYGVVPKCGATLKHTVNEIVTDLFIEDCVNQEQIVEIMYYHRPLSIKKYLNPLSGCVITMSMYTGVERTYLATLATELDAMVQDIFVRKTNIEKNTYGSTHLVCPTPEGNKYNAAVKWKLPAVTADWLKSCAAQSKRVDETPFLVGETIAPERPDQTENLNTSLSKTNLSQMGPPTEPAIKNIITPKRHLSRLESQESGSGDTPLINKRLSLLMNKTPQSPFHVSTPETPYGQVFKPDPSPDTRKGWIKWVDNFPDLRVEEPPLKKRALSTPLSELKKQLWQKLKKQSCNLEDSTDETLSTANDQSLAETKETVEPGETENDSCKATDIAPINRKLEFTDENSPLENNAINMQIAQLDQILQRTSSTPENRYSLSGEKANAYNTEPSDPIQKFIAKDSQPVDAIVWEDPSHAKRLTMREEENEDVDQNDPDADQTDEESVEEVEPLKRPKFMLSGIKDRTAYEQVIKDLGGDVSSDPTFDITATHLLCIRPSRNEKMLGSIASGKWVLHCMYLRDSEQEGKFLDEEKYEWGNPESKDVIPAPNGEIEETIAAAAYRWRLKLLKEPNGPFDNMVALLLVAGDKYDQFKRLIEAGGGRVVQARPPYDTSPTGKKITHCFVNVRQVSQPIDWAMLASKGILCFMPQYLSDYLTARTPLNPRECVIPEFKKYLTLLPK
ncbi:DNA topoisomerase 2-binding protein 1 isoform X2 [Osmia bicornis bicornis]|uniref:DNA topoisomerase 2-binding protein 1 isoform X2 n=1 Tax=Osmia bicornis bicornis TaxID=1437191 RepID=UPI001EAE9E15|nr:DNA topoisomerase 2-binding protein 1 isoform X2 [Osmia bicornis bicornis]